MEQHPVPQNISSYQFHLVGDMTLKQFLEIGGGVLVAVLFYATGLPGIIKLPLILISCGLGAALAFVPLEERPLEQWIFAFFRSVYSPTQFHWDKKQDVKYFADESATENTGASTQNTKTNPVSNIPFLNKLDSSESSYLSKLAGVFNPTVSQTATPAIETKQEIQTHNETVINHPSFNPNPINSASQSDSTQTQTTNTQTIPQINANTDNSRINVTASFNTNSSGDILTEHIQGGETPIQATPSVQQPKEVVVPTSGPISVEPTIEERPKIVVQEIKRPVEKIDITQTAVNPTLIGGAVGDAQQASFSVNAAPPSLPTIPNTISGQVMDSTSHIIEGAILEIKDAEGRAVRALRTNKAGHFLIVTPLINGKYNIVLEKEGYNFEPIEFEVNGGIIQPIAIRAKAIN
ncbi:MAG TPA: PrgI family protein [Patescibacteria group bacterium]|nr:PrgI family protein [Patescibacteria group bacterium]